jgi:hypothetical protein
MHITPVLVGCITVNCGKNLLTSAWFRKTVLIKKPFENSVVSNEGIPEKEKSDVFHAVLELPELNMQ